MLALAFVVVTTKTEQVRRPRSLDEVRMEGSFGRNGPITHGQPAPDGLAYWSSWAGDEGRRGTLILGPLRLPRRLGLFVSGYPRIGHNAILMENLETGEVFRQHTDNIGEVWRPVRLDFPQAWHGQQAIIRVVDDSEGWGGWIAASEPFTWPWWADWSHGFTLRLAAFVATMLVTALLVGGAGRLLVRMGWVPVSSVYLVPMAAGCVAVAGYLLFWIGLFSTAAMNLVAWLMFFGAALAALSRLPQAWDGPRCAVAPAQPERSANGNPATVWSQDWFLAAATTALCALFVFAILHLFASSGQLSELARSRFSAGTLPDDNTIPQVFAERVRAGALQIYSSPGDGLSSDRPPLQLGWLLALVPVSLRVGIDYDTAAQCAGIGFQCLTIPALWALLRSLGTSRTTSAAIVLAVVPSGFFFLNLTFVWPKMAAGAFAVLAFLLWFGDRQARTGVIRPDLVAGAFGGLAWLSHGGIGFALVALAPAVLWSCMRGNWRRWMVSAAGFLLLALPWGGYQKFYDPPGNRLLKWHLAGVIPPDTRGTLETFVTAYGERSLEEFVETQRKNWRTVYGGPWRDFASFSFADVETRRSQESFRTLLALGWWNLGWLALPLALLLRRTSRPEFAGFAPLLAWAIGTTVVWTLLIFIGGQTLIHQGPYSTLLLLFPILALGVLRLHPVLFAAAFTAQTVNFIHLWMSPPNAALGQGWQPLPLATGAGAVVASAAWVFALYRREKLRPQKVICDPTAGVS